MGRWYMVRHGETSWNAEGRIQGQTDIPMHDGGREAAWRTGVRLADIRFDAVYASDLSRTRETAELILAAQTAAPPPIVATPELREIFFGALEGLTADELEAVDPRAAHPQRARDLDYAPMGAESFRKLLDRLGAFGAELEAAHAGNDLLVVGHGGSLRALIITLLKLPYDALWRFRGLQPASLSVVIVDNGIASLTTWNDIGHLA